MNNRFLKYGCTMGLLYVTTSLFSQPMFTIIDDDAADVKQIQKMYELAEHHGIKACFGAIAQNVLKNPDITATLLRYQQKGHQICNHSLTHSSTIWMQPTPYKVKHELMRSSFILDSLGFKEHDFLVYPWGKFSNDVRAWLFPLVEKTFKLAFNSRGGACDLSHYNAFYINRFPLRKHENIRIVKDKINRAAKDGMWIVFLTHSNMARDFSPDYVSEIIAYCQQLGMKCVTVNKGYDILSKKRMIRKDETEDWDTIDELINFCYMHILWIILTGIVAGAIIIVTPIIRRLLPLILGIIMSSCSNENMDLPITFIGDSMINNWDVEKYFPNRICKNIGKDGAGIEYLNCIHVSDGIVVLLIGTNNLRAGMTERQINEYIEKYKAGIENISHGRVIFISVLPTQDIGKNDAIILFNETIKKWSSSIPRIEFIDCYDYFTDKKGCMRSNLTREGLHLNDYGYILLSHIVKEHL